MELCGLVNKHMADLAHGAINVSKWALHGEYKAMLFALLPFFLCCNMVIRKHMNTKWLLMMHTLCP